MARGPENLEAPNNSELKPKQDRREQTAKDLGRTAIRGTNKGK